MFGGDEVGALVLETGSSAVRAGYAGEDAPKCVFNTATGYLQPSESTYVGGNAGHTADLDAPAYKSSNMIEFPSFSRRFFMGNDATVVRPEQEILAPVQHGLIMDWEAVENIWDYALKNRLYADPYDHPIIMPEPVYNTKARREKMTQLMFERFSVPAYYLAKDPVLTAFSQGKQNALVVDIGSGKTCVVPVHEGYVLQNPSRKTKVAGDSLDALVYRQVLQTKGVRNVPCNYEYSKSMNRDGTLTSTRKQLPGPVTDSYRAYMQQAVIRDLKESLCRVHEQPFSEHLYAQLPRKPFVLPDGNVVDVGVERIMVGEALFNANLGLGSEVTVDLHPQQTFSGLHKMVCESIDACDVDIRRDLYSNIILGGGGSVMPGLQARLQLEVTTVIPHGIKCKVHTPATNAETRFASWIGGSVLASLGTFHQMWISRAEYEEFGAGILLRKCP